MGIIETTFSKFLSKRTTHISTDKKHFSHSEIAKHFCIRKGDFREILEKLEWIENVEDTLKITEQGTQRGASYQQNPETKEQEIVWDERIFKNEMLIYEINLFINDIFVYKIS